jgi:hypothetical protein
MFGQVKSDNALILSYPEKDKSAEYTQGIQNSFVSVPTVPIEISIPYL